MASPTLSLDVGFTNHAKLGYLPLRDKLIPILLGNSSFTFRGIPMSFQFIVVRKDQITLFARSAFRILAINFPKNVTLTSHLLPVLFADRFPEPRVSAVLAFSVPSHHLPRLLPLSFIHPRLPIKIHTLFYYLLLFILKYRNKKLPQSVLDVFWKIGRFLAHFLTKNVQKVGQKTSNFRNLTNFWWSFFMNIFTVFFVTSKLKVLYLYLF